MSYRHNFLVLICVLISELLLNLDLNPHQFHMPRPPTSSASSPAVNTNNKPSHNGHKSSGKRDSLPG